MTTSSSPRVSLEEWVQTALLVAILAWTTLCRGGVRAETMVVTTLLTAVLLVVHFLSRGWANRLSTSLHPAGWWLLPFLAYAAANVVWITPVRWLGWLEWLGWAQMVAVFWVTLNGITSRVPRRVVFFSLVALGLVGVVLASYQRFINPDWLVFGRLRPELFPGRASGSFGIANSFAGFVLLILPATGALAFRPEAAATERVWWGWVTFVLGFGLVLTISRGAWVALLVALTLWPLGFAGGGWWRRIRIAILTLSAVGLIGGIIYWKSPKVRERFTMLVMESGERTRPIMWRGAWQLFREAPVLGTGAASYNLLFERHRPEGFRDEPLWAHNEYLNTLSDYGAVGFILFFGAGLAIAGRCVFGRAPEKLRRRDWLGSRVVTSALGVGLFAFALQMALDFHFKIPALAITFATVAALAVSRAWTHEVSVSPGTSRARGWGLGAAAAVVALALWLLPRVQAEALRQTARRSIDGLGFGGLDKRTYAERLPAVRLALAQATERDPANGQAWSDRAYATSLWALVQSETTEALGREAEAHADRALKISSVNSEFFIRRGVARDMQNRWGDAGKDFAAAVALAPLEPYAWYYYADHLFKFKWAREPAEAALAFCLRLDPGNPAGLALRQRLAINPAAH